MKYLILIIPLIIISTFVYAVVENQASDEVDIALENYAHATFAAG